MAVSSRRALHWITAALFGVGAIVATGSAPAAAGTPCVLRNTRAALAAFGDNNEYFVAPNGRFESGAWEGTQSRTWENAPWKINGGYDGWSQRVDPSTWSISETFCVAANEDSVRLFVKRPGVWGAKLRVTLEVGSSTTPMQTVYYDLDGSSRGWTLSPRLAIPDARDAAKEQWMTIKLWTTGTNATWLVDDVMVDPWKAK